MIGYLIGVDGGGSGSRVRLASADGVELAQGRSGPAGLALGVAQAWSHIEEAVALAFAAAAVARPPRRTVGIGLGLAGAGHRPWVDAFIALNPGYAEIVVEGDGYTTLLGAHSGRPGAVVAVGTGSVGLALLPSGQRRQVGGWGFPSSDEGGGSWIGLQAVGQAQQALDGRAPATAFTDALIAACGGGREGMLTWATQANQTRYAALAPLVAVYGSTDLAARRLLIDAGRQIGRIADALDPAAALPMAMCGGLIEPLRDYLPAPLLARCVAAQGDSASGALAMIQRRVTGR